MCFRTRRRELERGAFCFRGDLVEFVSKYLSIPPLERHFYEIIRHRIPCRPYLDLEFAKSCNENADGDAMTRTIIDCMTKRLAQVYGVAVSPVDFLVLDSSTQTKFSRHVILNHQDVVFLDNNHVGAFIRSCVACGGEALWVRKKDGASENQMSCFVDLAVYTKNRAFRMYLSSKQGRASVLEPGPFNQFPFDDSTNASVAEFLKQSLVSVPTATVWTCIVASLNDAPSVRELEHQFGSGSAPPPNHRANSGARIRRSRHPAVNGPPSPFPLIDDQVCRIATSACPRACARVRSWALDEETSTLRLDIADNRYCFNARRAHKSNHVYYVVDIARGTIVQRCLDPDCRGFASSPPWHVDAKIDGSDDTIKGTLEQLIRVRNLLH